MIESRRHPLIARLRAAARGESDELLLDGPHLLGEALRSGTTLHAVVVAREAWAQPEVARLCRRAADAGVLVSEVTGAAASALSPTRTPSGIVALARLDLTPLPAMLSRAPALLLALVGVQDPGNVGGMVRTAEAAGVDGVLASNDTAHPLGWKALRGSMGSALRVPITRAADTVDALHRCRAAGMQMLVASAHRLETRPLDVRRPIVLVLGSEGRGLPDAVLAAADASISVALANDVESLNVGVAAGVLLFAIRRARLGVSVIEPPLDG